MDLTLLKFQIKKLIMNYILLGLQLRTVCCSPLVFVMNFLIDVIGVKLIVGFIKQIGRQRVTTPLLLWLARFRIPIATTFGRGHGGGTKGRKERCRRQ